MTFSAARKTMIGDIAFPSALEAAVYVMLKRQEDAGQIKDLRLQHCVRFAGTKIKAKIDFSYTDAKSGRLEFAEAKGREDRRWMVIKQLWETHGPAPLRIWKGSWRRPVLFKTITPNGGGRE